MATVELNRQAQFPQNLQGLTGQRFTDDGLAQKLRQDEIHVPYQRVKEIANKNRDITPSAALRLVLCFLTTTAA